MTKLTIALILGAAVCSAGPITYNVNQTIGSGGVTGTIETDGTTGVIPANTYLTSPTSVFLDWNLTLNDGTDPAVDLTPSNSELIVSGADLSATSNALTFNFGNGDLGFFLFVSTGPVFQQWCGSSALQCTQNPPFLDAGSDLQIGSVENFTAYADSQVIASVSSSPLGTSGPPVDTNDPPSDPIGTPEPSTFSFLGLGIAALGFWKYRAARSNV
jgi:hypothetical protein